MIFNRYFTILSVLPIFPLKFLGPVIALARRQGRGRSRRSKRILCVSRVPKLFLLPPPLGSCIAKGPDVPETQRLSRPRVKSPGMGLQVGHG